MAPYSVLITGANRGMGLGLVKYFLKDKDIQHVIATAREPSSAKELNEITDMRLTVLKLDVTSDESIDELYSQVSICRKDRRSAKLSMLQSALNSIMKTMSVDLAPEHILVAMFCPGWVKTDMGGPNAHLQIEESMEQLVPSMYKLTKEHHGGYFNRDLTAIAF
ncbi:hypothetical protein OESDEN_05072 [Oesophagostomum dentatum]|uniref:Oxidoreductase, short chain dehydrogenase/reductase family protein n=1 Tax=Oesophagostomum dentatum TaxID=61180 RepID=A0A0B1TCH9_OESDE|nr:hypothetical protein OESDEN_05072 [Oesophagostomum dentatum]